MLIVRQNTAKTIIVGPVLDANGVAVTDCIIGDFKISRNGGAPAALDSGATLTHRHTGHYSLSLTASDLNTVGIAEITIDDTVNACATKELIVVEEAIYDALFAVDAAGYQVPIPPVRNTLRKNQAGKLYVLMTDANGTPQTGLVVTCKRSLDGGTLATISGTVDEVGEGVYVANLNAADTNGDFIAYRFSAAGAATVLIGAITQQV